MQPEFECHITCLLENELVGKQVAAACHWKTSQIERDPLLGNNAYFYLTSHGSTYAHIHGRMKTAVEQLRAKGATVVREKIELIVYDTKKSLVPDTVDSTITDFVAQLSRLPI